MSINKAICKHDSVHSEDMIYLGSKSKILENDTEMMNDKIITRKYMIMKIP